MRKTSISLLFILLLNQFPNRSFAQDLTPIQDSVYSEVLKESRKLKIYLPSDYKPESTSKYDVIYVLDGDWNNTKVTINAQQFLQRERFMPAAIIVAINNTYVGGVNYRDRDFTPTQIQGRLLPGYAGTFLSFLKKELVPYINKTYPSTGEGTLFGHSLGGLFAMYAFLNEPDLFQSYLVADPSFWWDNNYMTAYTRKKLDSLQGVKKSIFICGRGGRQSAGMGIPSIDSVLKEKAPAGLIWKNVDYPGETHNSLQYKAVYDGLKFFYTGYGTSSIKIHPMNGVVLKNKPAKVWFDGDPGTVFYTMDGTEPTSRSIPISSEISINGPAELKVKLMSNRGFDKTLTGQFKEGKALRSISKPKDLNQGGLKYSYYEGEWDKLPDFKQLTPVKTGTTDKNFTFAVLPRQNNFALLFEGYFEISKEGYYTFGMEADDGARLYLGDQLIIDRDGIQSNSNAVSYVLPLEKGFYPFRLEYFVKSGNRALGVVYVTPDASEPRPIPLEIQYSH
jgi:predicted alpha/beta superfamily hydrolase